MLRQALKSCSHSKSDFFGCVLFELVISHITKWFSNSIAFSNWYHSVTSPLCFLFSLLCTPRSTSVFSVSQRFYNLSVQTFSHSVNNKTNLWITLCSSIVLRFFFLPSDPSTGVKILFHCFHSLNSELGLWMQLDDRAPELWEINCCSSRLVSLLLSVSPHKLSHSLFLLSSLASTQIDRHTIGTCLFLDWIHYQARVNAFLIRM